MPPRTVSSFRMIMCASVAYRCPVAEHECPAERGDLYLITFKSDIPGNNAGAPAGLMAFCCLPIIRVDKGTGFKYQWRGRGSQRIPGPPSPSVRDLYWRFR